MRKFILSIVLLASACSISAQRKYEGFTGSARTNVSFYAREFKPVELSIGLGHYLFDGFFLSLEFESAVALFDTGGNKDFFISETLGLAAGYNFWTFSGGVLDARISGGTSVGGKGWKYNYYDAGIYCNIGYGKSKPTLGFGVRYYDPKKNGAYSDYFRFFFSIGFKFN